MTHRILFALLMTLLVTPAWAGELTLDVLDIGQGDAILIESEGGKRVLVDAGVRKDDVVQLLQARGIERLDMVVATHPHADHIGGMELVLRTFDVGLYIDNGLPHSTGTYERVMKAVEERGIPYRSAQTGQRYRIEDDAELLVLWPGAQPLTGTRSDLNSNSVILRLINGDDCVLLTGDAEAPTEQHLVAAELEPCEVLKVAHHGGDHSSTPRFLDAVQPRLALISVGASNRYGHPGDETMGRLLARQATVYRTDLMGTIQVRSTGSGVSVTTARDVAPIVAAPGVVYEGGASGHGQGHVEAPAAPAATGGQLDLNSATAEQLQELPGIGPSKAQAIVADRTQNGPFGSVDDLTRVRGIGQGTLNNLRPHVTIGGAAGPAVVVASAGGEGGVGAGGGAPIQIAQADDGRLDLNSATAEQLQELPGIGPSKAQAIVADRTQNGPFGSVDDLTRVRGIGQGTLNNLRALVTVGASPAPQGALPQDAPPQGAPPQGAPSQGAPPQGAPPQDAPSQGAPPQGAPPAAGGVNINTATVEQLRELPGIGPSKAQAIVAERTQNGAFATCQDLTRVRGIGPSTVNNLLAQCRTQ